MSGKSMIRRRDLIKLIYRLDTFSEEELREKFRDETRGDMSIGGCQTIKDYINDLTQIGSLRYEDGRYSVAP